MKAKLFKTFAVAFVLVSAFFAAGRGWLPFFIYFFGVTSMIIVDLAPNPDPRGKEIKQIPLYHLGTIALRSPSLSLEENSGASCRINPLVRRPARASAAEAIKPY